MTNEQIIFSESQKLAERGAIAYTGRTIAVVFADGTRGEVQEAEAIHTFAEWKALGFMVKKGQHAVAKFPIWRFTERTRASRRDEETEDRPDPHYYMKVSAFFSASQVEAMKEGANS